MITDFEGVMKEINNLSEKKQQLNELFMKQLDDNKQNHDTNPAKQEESATNQQNTSSEILYVPQQFLFDTNNIGNVENLFQQLNRDFELIRHEWEAQNQSDSKTISEENTSKDDILSNALNYLTSINVYPNDKLTNTSKKTFSGQLVACVIFVHIDIDQTIQSKYKFQHCSMKRSISFEFDGETLKILFSTIQQLDKVSMNNLLYIFR
ncbi:unnamed protein product [Adineta ricciae]|uniref:Uncharacterized protein n=1 Tax=Adineta ricciae TaxID=249248 RepID=A0A815N1H8_ADIRI|nr:unnamed protein product [Adineta ricciae]